LTVEPRMHIEPVDEDWTLVELGQREDDLQTLIFSSLEPRTRLSLGLSSAESEQNESLIVERMWGQSWVTGKRRLDRTVFRFRTQHDRLKLRLPSGSTSETYQPDDGGSISALPCGP